MATMGFRKYAVESGMQGEPAGLVLLSAADSGEIWKSENPFCPSVGLLLADIGINEGDSLKNIQSKIAFVVRSLVAGTHEILPSKNEEHNIEQRASLKTPSILDELRLRKLLAKTRGETISSREILRQLNASTLTDVLKEDDEDYVQEARSKLEAVLQWLNDQST